MRMIKQFPKNKPYRFKSHAEKMKIAAEVWERDDYSCQNPNCSLESMIDSFPHHIQFKSQGGGDVIENLITVCMECHDLIHKRKLYVNSEFIFSGNKEIKQ